MNANVHMPAAAGSAARRACLTFLFLSAVLATAPPPADAESLFAREALGEWIDGYDMRGEALGSTGIGTIDAYNLSALNPAASAWAPFVLGYIGMQGIINWTEDGHSTARRSSGTITGAGVAIPISKVWGLRFLLRPQTDGTYGIEEVADIGSADPEANTHREEGSRGLLSYSADLTFRPGRSLAVGLRGGLLAGSLLDETSYDFGESGWTDTEDRRTMRCKPTFRYGAGFQWSPLGRLSLGGAVIRGAPMTLEEIYTAPAGADYRSETYELDHPATYGAGLALFLAPRWRVSADVVYREWEALEWRRDGDVAAQAFDLRNTTAYGIGLERVAAQREPGLRSRARLAWRLGYAFVPWYANDAGGDAIDEHRFSLGMGVPVKHDRGSLDFTLSYGRRGNVADNGIAEQYLRIGMGAIFGTVPRGY